MLARQVSSLVFSASILVFNFPADANPLGLNESDLAFCSAVRDQRVREAVSSSQMREDLRVNTNFDLGYTRIIGVHGDSQGSGRNIDKSSSSREQAMSQYQSKNCEQLLQAASKVTVAQIEANAKTAIAQLRFERDQYAEDIKKEIALIDIAAIENTNAANVQMTDIDAHARVRIEELKQAGRVEAAQLIAETLQRKVAAEQSGQTQRAKIEADALVSMTRDTNATNLAIAQDDNRTNENIAGINANAQKTQTIVQAVSNTLGTVFASSGQTHQQKLAAEVEKERIAAEIEKAKIAASARIATEIARQKIADANAEISAANILLAEWGWTKVACYSGAVFIMGLGNDPICVNPNTAIASGQYRYESVSNQLMPLTSVTNSAPTPVQPAFNTVPVQNV